MGRISLRLAEMSLDKRSLLPLQVRASKFSMLTHYREAQLETIRKREVLTI